MVSIEVPLMAVGVSEWWFSHVVCLLLLLLLLLFFFFFSFFVSFSFVSFFLPKRRFIHRIKDIDIAPV